MLCGGMTIAGVPMIPQPVQGPLQAAGAYARHRRVGTPRTFVSCEKYNHYILLQQCFHFHCSMRLPILLVTTVLRNAKSDGD